MYSNDTKLFKMYSNETQNYSKCTATRHKIIQNVQQRDTKLIPILKTLTHRERLRKIHLPTSVNRRARGDMIETHNIYTEICDRNIYVKIC